MKCSDKRRYKWKTLTCLLHFCCSVDKPGRKKQSRPPCNRGFIMSDGFQREIKWRRERGVQAWGLRVKGVSDSGSVTPLISQTTHLRSKRMKLKTENNNNKADLWWPLTVLWNWNYDIVCLQIYILSLPNFAMLDWDVRTLEARLSCLVLCHGPHPLIPSSWIPGPKVPCHMSLIILGDLGWFLLF